MLHRTTVLLPPALKSQAVKTAAAEKVSFGELVRVALELYLMEKRGVVRDAFFNDHRVYEGDAPSDLAKNHDNYLYGE